MLDRKTYNIPLRIIREAVLQRINDPQTALQRLGLTDLVIKKFADQITLADLLAHARKAILGFNYTSQPPEQDSVGTKSGRLYFR